MAEPKAPDATKTTATAAPATATTPLLTEADAAEFLAAKPGTLRAWRAKRIGPPFFQLSGRSPRYRREDLVAWVATCARTTGGAR